MYLILILILCFLHLKYYHKRKYLSYNQEWFYVDRLNIHLYLKFLNKGFRYIDGQMKSYEQSKRGLSYVYHKRIVCDDGVTTKPLLI